MALHAMREELKCVIMVDGGLSMIITGLRYMMLWCLVYRQLGFTPGGMIYYSK